jgi:hypothetical protein
MQLVDAVCFALQARHIFSHETNVRLLFFIHTKSVFFSSRSLIHVIAIYNEVYSGLYMQVSLCFDEQYKIM